MKYTFILVNITTLRYLVLNYKSVNAAKDELPTVNEPLSRLEHTISHESTDSITKLLSDTSKKSKRRKSSSSTKAPYSRLDKYKTNILLKVLETNTKPCTAYKKALSIELKVSKDKINNWFQNQRRMYRKAKIINTTTQFNQNKTPINVLPLIQHLNSSHTEEKTYPLDNYILNLKFEEIITLAKAGYMHMHNLTNRQ